MVGFTVPTIFSLMFVFLDIYDSDGSFIFSLVDVGLDEKFLFFLPFDYSLASLALPSSLSSR